MSEVRDIFGVMNSDLAPRRLENGDYLYALNIRNSGSTGNQIGFIEQIAGAQKREFDLPAGFNTCIGYFSDEETEYIYYFVANSNGQHLIMRYNYGNTLLERVLQSEILAFDDDHRIVEVAIIGDQLFFNDAKNEVRRIDLTNTVDIPAPSDLPTIWEFDTTLSPNADGNVELSQSEPGQPLPPFQVGQQICVIRDWRDAWIDAYNPNQLGTGVIDIQSITADGAVAPILIDGIYQFLFSVPFTVGGEQQLAEDIAAAFNNHVPWSGPDFTAYVDPDDPTNVIVVAPEGTSDSYNGTQIVVNVQGGPPPPAVVIGGAIGGIIEDQEIGCKTATFHKYDPNPSYSGVHTVIEVNNNSIVIDTPPTDNQDELQANFETSFIGGRAYLYNPLLKYNLPLEENTIKLYRPSPPFAPWVEYGSDDTVKTNNLKGRLFQFKTRFVYENGMKSAPSPISKLITPVFEKNVPFQETEVWRDNFMNIWFDTGGKDVVGIELMVKESSNPVNQDWYALPLIRKEEQSINSNTSHKFSFYGNEVYVAMDQAEATQPMDYIPHVARAFTFIRDNRNAMGGCEEGFDHFDVDVSCSIVDCSTTAAEGGIILRRWPPDDYSFFLGLISTPDLLPVQQSIWFPLNKAPEIESGTYYIGGSLLPGAPAGVTNPFWKYIKNNDGHYIFSQEVPPLFDDGWEYSANNPHVKNYVPGDTSAGYRAYHFDASEHESYPWIPVAFTFFHPPLNPGGLSAPDQPPVGSVFSVYVQFRLSRSLVWADQQTSLSPTNPTITYFPSGGGAPYNFEGIIGFEPSSQSGQNGFYIFTQIFTKVIQDGDTPESVRDYFLNEINNSEILNREIEVEIALYEIANTNIGGVKKAVFNVGVVASTTDLGVGNPNTFSPPEPLTPTTWADVPLVSSMFVRPSVDFVSLEEGAGEFLTSNGMTMNIMAEIYQKIGANRLRINANVASPSESRIPKTGATHQAAIEYRDIVGRRFTVSPIKPIYVPYRNEKGSTGSLKIALLFKIFNLAPTGAHYYQFMYAGNQSMEKWIDFEVNWVDFDSDNDGIKIALSPRLTRYNNAVNAGDTTSLSDINGRAELSYSYTRGDRIRFLSFWTGDQTDEENAQAIDDIENTVFFDAEIVGEATEENQGLVIIVNENEVLPYIEGIEFGSGTFVEVYTPKDNARDDQLVYNEIGETFKIDSLRHRGNRLNQGGATPGGDYDYAEVILKGFGDAFVISRKKLPVDGVNRSKDRLVESQWFSDFYPSQTWGPGTANLYNPQAKRELKKAIIRFSDFIVGQNNNLNRYYDANLNDEADVMDGIIQRLICPDDTMHVIQELNHGLIGINVAELLSATGSSSIMRSDNVLGQIRYIPGNWGITNQRESLTLYDGIIFYASQNKGAFVMVSGTQVQAISRLGQDNYFNEVFNNMSRQLSDNIRIISGFDPKHGELIVYVPEFAHSIDPNDWSDFKISEAHTLAYSLGKKGWVTEYPYHPEMIGCYRNKLITWKSGQLYTHHDTENWNQYYDGEEPQDSVVKLVFNKLDTAIKFARSIGVEVRNSRPKRAVITTNYRTGQRTTLVSTDFSYQEDQYFSKILRDELTPGVDLPVINGDRMRGTYFVVELRFGPERRFELYAVSLNYVESKRTINR